MTTAKYADLRVLVVSGSSRAGSFNALLAQAAAAQVRGVGAQATLADLRGLDLPLYDGDLEARQGVPEGARVLRQLVVEHDALIVSAPEYNALPTPLLLNSFDWLSRLAAEGSWPAGSVATAGKVVGLLAASPGGFGGVRALPIVRQFLATNFGMVVAPEHFALNFAHQAFDEQGALKQTSHQEALARVVQGVLRLAHALKQDQGQ